MLTDKSNLAQVVEATLFVAGQGVEIADLVEKLEVDKKDVIKAIDELKKKFEGQGINVITYKDSVQLCSNPEFADDIAAVLNPIREKQLTKAALETAAIIAYKQPVTKLDIEQIRGVSSDYAIQVLTTFKLIEVVGRKDVVGKPLLYGTTDEFLKRFELQSIEDLPDYDELIERIKVIHAEDKVNDALYGSTEIIPEEQLADSQSRKDNQDEATYTKADESQDGANLIGDSEDNVDKNDTPASLNDNDYQAFDENEVKKVLDSVDNQDDDAIIDNFKDDVL